MKRLYKFFFAPWWFGGLIIMAITNIFYIGTIITLFEKNYALEADLKIQANTLMWAEAQRDMLEDVYLVGESYPATAQEWIVMQEYLRWKGETLREELILKIIDGIHYQTKEKYQDKPVRVRWVATLIYENAKEYRIPYELMIATMWTESHMRNDICMGYHDSNKGAIGCMQVMPFWVDKLDFVDSVEQLRFDLTKNVKAGAHVLRFYMDHPYAKMVHPILAALTMYNGGPSKLRRDMAAGKRSAYAVDTITNAVRIKSHTDL